jgi:hypothetical protein
VWKSIGKLLNARCTSAASRVRSTPLRFARANATAEIRITTITSLILPNLLLMTTILALVLPGPLTEPARFGEQDASCHQIVEQTWM